MNNSNTIVIIFLATTILPVATLAILGFRSVRAYHRELMARRPGLANVRAAIASLLFFAALQGLYWVGVLSVQYLFPSLWESNFFAVPVLGIWISIWGGKLVIAWKMDRDLEGYRFSRLGRVASFTVIVAIIGVIMISVRGFVALVDPEGNFTYSQEIYDPLNVEVAPGDALEIPIGGTRRNNDSLTFLFGEYNCGAQTWRKEIEWNATNVVGDGPESREWGFVYQTVVPEDIPPGLDCIFVQATLNLPAVSLQSYEAHFRTIEGDIHVSD